MENLSDLLAVNNSNVFDFIGLIFTVCSIPVGIYTWKVSKDKDRQAEELEHKKEQEQKEREIRISEQRVRELNNRNFVELTKEYRREFRLISLHEKDNQAIYKHDIDHLKKLGRQADEIRTSVFFIIDTLKNAFILIKETNSPINGSLWDEHFYYVFDPVRKPIFVSAFRKKAEEYKWLENPRLDEFVTFVEQVIKENQEKHNEKTKEAA